MKLGLFGRTVVPAEEQKQVMVLGTMGELDAGLRSRIIAFNQENSRYRITVRQYVTYNEEMPLQSYIEKGLLTDVGKLLEEDAELSEGTEMVSETS